MAVPGAIKAVVRRLASGMYALLEVLGLPRVPDPGKRR